MKKALLLHGWEGTSKGCWFPWLKKELEQKGFEVFVPDLPNTEKPVFTEQISEIQKYAEFFGKGDIIIGHSLGCSLAVNFLEENKLKKINVILVAPTYPKLGEEIKEMLGESYKLLQGYYGLSNTFEKLHNSYTILLSDNDPYITMESAKQYYNNFTLNHNNSVEYSEFHKWYHFSDNAPAPIKEIPKILNYIK